MPFLNFAIDKLNAFYGAFQNIWNSIGTFAENVINGLLDLLSDFLGGFISAINVVLGAIGMDAISWEAIGKVDFTAAKAEGDMIQKLERGDLSIKTDPIKLDKGVQKMA
ncbi:unnamed protein product, partial [marine sediment metagenome]